jgi:hypothetical protein
MPNNGHPLIGAITGLLFGLFLAIDLLLLGAFRLDNALVILLPVLSLIVGIAAGLFAPLKMLSR